MDGLFVAEQEFLLPGFGRLAQFAPDPGQLLAQPGVSEAANLPGLERADLAAGDLVLFDGSELVWNLTSNNNNDQESLYAEANSGSFVCGNASARIASDAQKVQPKENPEEIIGFKFYPNPVKDKLVIELGNATTTSEINLFNSQGKSCKMQGVVNSSSSTVEIDMSSMSDGLYILRLKVGEDYKTLRVIKIGDH